ncbi:hypothetical protein LXL04_032727 [Taraxacum kok-saghyz]
MDRRHWMYKLKRSDDEYLAGLGGFLKTAEENRLKKGESYIWCPCKDCENCQKKNRFIVEEHLIRRGFMGGYTCWSRHGKTLDRGGVVSNLNKDNVDSNNKYTKLSAVLKLLNLKANGRWSDTSFTSLLEFLNDMLPEGPKQPGNDIDVYLAPLIEDMKTLWSPGVEMYDAFSGENFQPPTMIYLDTGKLKDGKPVREDIMEMGIRHELAPVESPGKRTFLPAACYTMSKAEKTKFCKCLHGVKVSIIEGYATEEVIEYCTDYLQGVTSIGVPISRHEGRLVGVGTIRLKKVIPSREDFQLAHFTVLQHMTIIAPYINEHKRMLEMANRGRSKRWLITDHNKTFSQWLKDKVKASYGLETMDKIVQHLGSGSEHLVTTYRGYDISGYTFYTDQQDHKKIWELKYDSIIIPLFKCKWVHNQHGVRVNNDRFTIVDLSTNGYVSEPFILAKQATQVFYIEDPKDSRKHIVMHSKRRILGVDNVEDEEEYDH